MNLEKLIQANFAAQVLERLEAIQLVSLTETKESEFGLVQGDSPVMRNVYNEALKAAAEEVMKLLKK